MALTSIPAVDTLLSENGHPGYVVVTSRAGLNVGAIIDLHSSSVNQLGLKVQSLDGRKVYLWNRSTDSAFDATPFLTANGAHLVQAAQDLFGGLIREFFGDPKDDETPLATSELADILLSVLPPAVAPASNVTVTNFPAQQHVAVDNVVGTRVAPIQNTGSITAIAQNIQLDLNGSASAAITLTGVWSGTVAFEMSGNAGATWVPCEVFDILTEQAEITAVGINSTFMPVRLAGITHIRVRSTAWTSGTAAVYLSGVASPINIDLSSTENGDTAPSYGVMVGGLDSGSGNLVYLKVAADGTLQINQTVFTDGSQKTQVTNFPADQLVHAASLPLPTGAATSAIQTNGTQQAQVVSSGNVLAVDASGRIGVNVNGTVPVSGTFFQATQPVSAASLPLPTGAATEATLATRASQTTVASILAALNPLTRDPFVGEAALATRVILPIEHISAFGEFQVTQKTAILSLDFNYSINPLFVKTVINLSGSASAASSMATLQTGTNANGSAQIESISSVRYIAGTGVFSSFTALFTTGVASSQQEVGLGDLNDGVFFGYQNSSFGVFLRKASVDTFTPQASFSVDKGDGTGQSGFTITPTNLELFKVEFGWHGSGPVKYYVFDVQRGRWVLLHVISGGVVAPRMLNPTLPLHMRIANSGNTTNLTIKSASMGAYRESTSSNDTDTNLSGATGSVGNVPGTTGPATVTTEVALFTIRCDPTFQGLTNRVVAQVVHSMFSVGGGTDARFRLVKNATLGGTPSFATVNSNNVISVDFAGTTVASGVEVGRRRVDANGSTDLELADHEIFLSPGDTLTLAAATTTGANAEALEGSLTWNSLFSG